MGIVNWGGFAFESKLLVNTTKCVTCREDIPVTDINANGMCDTCVDIENRMLERLAGKWADMVFKEEEENKWRGWW